MAVIVTGSGYGCVRDYYMLVCLSTAVIMAMVVVTAVAVALMINKAVNIHLFLIGVH